MSQILLLIVKIIAVNVVYVSLFTLRLILMIKGRRSIASLLSMVEVFVYLIGLTFVLNRLDSPWTMAAYCLGFGLGVYTGSRIEERLALGYLHVQVIVNELDYDLAAQLREAGFGVTTWPADGRDGIRLVLHVLVTRKNERVLMNKIGELAPKAFVVSYEPKTMHGGFWTNRVL